MKLSDTQYLVAAVVSGGTVYRLETAQFSKDETTEAQQELQYHLSKGRPARIFVAQDAPKKESECEEKWGWARGLVDPI